LPAALAGQLAGAPEWVVLTQPGSRPQPWPGAQRTLCFGGATGADALAATDETARLRGELDLLTQELADLELELATAQAEVADFAHRYHRLVGGPMAELDALRAEIARQRAANAGNDEGMAKEATEAKARASRSQREHRRFAEINEAAAKPFAPSSEIKKLYRHLAQKIHPDRAADEDERAWRTQLMTEANRAYRAGDAQALEELLALWREGARPGTAPTGGGLAAQVARLKSRVAAIETELNRLFGSRLYELFTAAQMARRKGRDLLQEMADRLEGEIAAAKGMLAGIS
ncbi:MAG TPA: J domain-containing protein, partial [Rhodocyclaceae bacterium]|nr:J domain-containing protein [Rhodocyclaceae bacterium]